MLVDAGFELLQLGVLEGEVADDEVLLLVFGLLTQLLFLQLLHLRSQLRVTRQFVVMV